MPACSSEVQPPYTDEVYARSLSTLERVGALAVAHSIEESDGEGVLQLLQDDFATGILENLRTAPGIESHLDIERERWYRMDDGRATAADGTPMVEIIERGRQYAEAAGRSDPRMQRQERRDEGDLIIARQADALQPGQLLLAVSLPPLEGLEADEQYWRDLGYRPDLAYVQTYYKSEDGQAMVAGSFSVGACDAAAWRRVLESYGVAVPADATADDFIRSFAVLDVSAEAAQGLGRQVRERYYREIGDDHRRQSVTEYLAAQEEVVAQYFDRYMLPLAEAVHTGRNIPALQQLAQAILNTPAVSRFSPTVVEAARRVAEDSTFPRSAGAVMENLIRYALVERLRGGLVAVVGGAELDRVRLGAAQDMPYEILSRQLASDVSEGIQAGRNYGGCSSLVLNNEQSGEPGSPQEAYGRRGADNKEDWQWKVGTCRVKNCPSPNPTKVGPCHVCVRCQRLFDLGKDPTKGVSERTQQRTDHVATIIRVLRSARPATPNKATAGERSFGGVLLAA